MAITYKVRRLTEEVVYDDKDVEISRRCVCQFDVMDPDSPFAGKDSEGNLVKKPFTVEYKPLDADTVKQSRDKADAAIKAKFNLP